MTEDTLKRNLRHLHETLATSDSLDSETRELLARIAGDIEQILAGEEHDSDKVRDRIQSAAWRFEASHPALARALSEVTDALAKLGI